MSALVGATLAVRDAEATARRYERWLDYRVVERARVCDDLAAAWDAPTSRGRICIVMAPASGVASQLRLVEAATPASVPPLRTFGWTALEIVVQDVEAMHERLRPGPFEVIGPPRKIGALPVIHPMQMLGPDGELLYLTEILQGGPGSGLPTAQAPIDAPFIAVAGCSDFRASAHWFGRCAGMSIAPEIEMPYRTLSQAFELPGDTPHRFTTASHAGDYCVELDQLPAAARPRAREAGSLPAGIASCSFMHPALDALRGPWLAAPSVRDGAFYRGRRAGTMRAPDDLLVEWIEGSPAEGAP